MTRTSDTSSTFGFEEVAPQDRQSRVNSVFANVAERYDLMNDLMSGGLHREHTARDGGQVRAVGRIDQAIRRTPSAKTT
ncbi:MAG: class I SAM-dependent methyltransferase, partial [Pseudomonadota bacterium]